MSQADPSTQHLASPATAEAVVAAAPMRWWRRVSLRRQMVYGFALPVAIVLLASLSLLRALDTMTATANHSAQSTDAIGLRYVLLNAVLDSETGVRGYLLTSDPEFLVPYERALADMRRVVERLEASEMEEPEHMEVLRTAQAEFLRWRLEFAAPLIARREAAPVGAAEEARQLAALAAQAAHAGGEDLHDRLAALRDRFPPGGRKARIDNLVTGMESERIQDWTALAPSLAELADAMQADADRITADVQAKRGKRITDEIRVLVARSLQDELAEERESIARARASAERARWIAVLAPVGALVVGLSLVLLLLLDAIRAIGATTKAADAVAGGDLDKRVRVMREDELGKLGRTFNRMAAELADRRRRSMAIDKFQTLLITSDTTEEIYAAVTGICTELFPQAGGTIYRIAASRNLADRVARWNWPASDSGMLDPEECRALRTGRAYLASADSIEVPCRHTARLQPPAGASVCLPLTAHGETFGIMQLCRFGPPVLVSGRNLATAVLIGEQLSLSLANLQLRDKLRNQSIRDPLTGLFNRRYLEETLARELARCARSGQSLTVAVLDVDHFKRFNDTHGHEAGDRVLVELAAVLRDGVRSTDVACRYGGEEFVLLMPDTPVEAALARVDALRQQAGRLQLRFGTGPLQPITFSAGLATAPGDARDVDALLRAADTALYDAKARGRDRVVAYQPP